MALPESMQSLRGLTLFAYPPDVLSKLPPLVVANAIVDAGRAVSVASEDIQASITKEAQERLLQLPPLFWSHVHIILSRMEFSEHNMWTLIVDVPFAEIHEKAHETIYEKNIFVEGGDTATPSTHADFEEMYKDFAHLKLQWAGNAPTFRQDPGKTLIPGRKSVKYDLDLPADKSQQINEDALLTHDDYLRSVDLERIGEHEVLNLEIEVVFAENGTMPELYQTMTLGGDEETPFELGWNNNIRASVDSDDIWVMIMTPERDTPFKISQPLNPVAPARVELYSRKIGFYPLPFFLTEKSVRLLRELQENKYPGAETGEDFPADSARQFYIRKFIMDRDYHYHDGETEGARVSNYDAVTTNQATAGYFWPRGGGYLDRLEGKPGNKADYYKHGAIHASTKEGRLHIEGAEFPSSLGPSGFYITDPAELSKMWTDDFPDPDEYEWGKMEPPQNLNVTNTTLPRKVRSVRVQISRRVALPTATTGQQGRMRTSSELTGDSTRDEKRARLTVAAAMLRAGYDVEAAARTLANLSL